MSTSLSRPLSIEKPHSTTYRPDESWSANDALYGLGTLLLCFLFTQSAWTLVIRPHAAAVLQQVVVVTSADKVQHAVHQLRSIFVILKDYEQQLKEQAEAEAQPEAEVDPDGKGRLFKHGTK